MARIAVTLVLIISAFSLARAQSAPPPDAFFVHGVHRTCDSISLLDRALSVEDSSYFSGWSSKDFDEAAKWAALCVSEQYRFIGRARSARLRAYQEKMTQPPTPVQAPWPEQAATYKMAVDELEQQRLDSAQAAAKAAAQQARAEEAREKKRQAGANAIAQCHHSDAYRAFQAQERLRADILTQDRISEALEREQKIEQVSGVQNLSRDYELGERTVHIGEVIEKDWRDYRLAGGESTKDTGLMLVDNPCIGAAPTSDE